MQQTARPRRWIVPNASPRGGEIEIAGWDYGGDGPLIMMHHANGLCGAPWALVAAALRDDYRVIAIDARGHGGSEQLKVPDDYEWIRFSQDLTHVARQMIAETGVERVQLGLGSSFGGIVTAMAEASQPGLFASIMMLDPPIHPREELLQELGLDLPPEDGDRRNELVAQTLRRRAVWDSREQAYAAWRDKALFKPWREQAFELYLTEGMADRVDGSVELKCPPEVEAHIFASTGRYWPYGLCTSGAGAGTPGARARRFFSAGVFPAHCADVPVRRADATGRRPYAATGSARTGGRTRA